MSVHNNYLFIDLAINPTHLRDLQRKTGELPGPKGPKGGAEEHDKRTDNPCLLERRALPVVATHYFDLELRLPGEVDA